MCLWNQFAICRGLYVCKDRANTQPKLENHPSFGDGDQEQWLTVYATIL